MTVPSFWGKREKKKKKSFSREMNLFSHFDGVKTKIIIVSPGQRSKIVGAHCMPFAHAPTKLPL